MNIPGLVAAGREAHERLMVDTVAITRVTQGTFNTTSGSYATASASVYSGKCRLRGPGAGGAATREVEAGEAEQITFRYQLLLPYQSATVRIGDIATIGSRTFTVVGQTSATTTTAQALLVEEVQT